MMHKLFSLFTPRLKASFFVFLLFLLTVVSPTLTHAANGRTTYRVPRDFPTIQTAVDAASPGDAIIVSPGTYAENITITTPGILLKGKRAILDGAPSGGNGIGLHVLGTADAPVTGVEIRGFVVQNFERGIVLEHAEYNTVAHNETHHNTDKNPADGLFNMADGIVLNAASHNTIRRNYTHHNGHNGMFLIQGSSNNLVQGNLATDNGAQTGEAIQGCGIQIARSANNDNQIIRNRTLRNAWGIQIGPVGESTGNLIAYNQAHGQMRAGIAVLGPAHDNIVQYNNATGNGRLNAAP
ncbi:MAG TPA: DUF1565 domain-containing protein, partial [Anaerolineae bacterium]|nr:DUF1565 domain-containing protein [Anaerolineae bacterium]